MATVGIIRSWPITARLTRSCGSAPLQMLAAPPLPLSPAPVQPAGIALLGASPPWAPLRQQQNSSEVVHQFTIGYLCGFAWCVGTMLYQFVGLATGEVEFNVFTVVAIVIAAAMLFRSSAHAQA